jgi:hypothetical protein
MRVWLNVCVCVCERGWAGFVWVNEMKNEKEEKKVLCRFANFFFFAAKPRKINKTNLMNGGGELLSGPMNDPSLSSVLRLSLPTADEVGSVLAKRRSAGATSPVKPVTRGPLKPEGGKRESLAVLFRERLLPNITLSDGHSVDHALLQLGDSVVLSPGTVLATDCVVVSSSDLVVTSGLREPQGGAAGKTMLLAGSSGSGTGSRRGSSARADHSDGGCARLLVPPQPAMTLLLASDVVVDGSGTAVVLRVGQETYENQVHRLAAGELAALRRTYTPVSRWSTRAKKLLQLGAECRFKDTLAILPAVRTVVAEIEGALVCAVPRVVKTLVRTEAERSELCVVAAMTVPEVSLKNAAVTGERPLHLGGDPDNYALLEALRECVSLHEVIGRWVSTPAEAGLLADSFDSVSVHTCVDREARRQRLVVRGPAELVLGLCGGLGAGPSGGGEGNEDPSSASWWASRITGPPACPGSWMVGFASLEVDEDEDLADRILYMAVAPGMPVHGLVFHGAFALAREPVHPDAAEVLRTSAARGVRWVVATRLGGEAALRALAAIGAITEPDRAALSPEARKIAKIAARIRERDKSSSHNSDNDDNDDDDDRDSDRRHSTNPNPNPNPNPNNAGSDSDSDGPRTLTLTTEGQPFKKVSCLKASPSALHALPSTQADLILLHSADLLDKLEAVKGLQSTSGDSVIAFLGRTSADVPAMAAADVAITVDANSNERWKGSLALEVADIILPVDKIGSLPHLAYIAADKKGGKFKSTCKPS